MQQNQFLWQVSGHRKCNRCPTKATVVSIVQIAQIQRARVIFNPLTDIFIKCFSVCFILISLLLQGMNFVREEIKVIIENPKNWYSRKSFSCERWLKIFWGNPHGVPVNSEYSQELCRTMNDLDLCEHLPHFLSFENWPPNVELSFHQVHCFCQNLSWIEQCQKNWFCGKLILCLDDFYPLLRGGITSTLIQIGVKRISQACCLQNLKNMEKHCKIQLLDKKQNRVLYLGHPVLEIYFNNTIIANFFLFFFKYFRIRKYIHIVVSSKYFDNVILALILISSGLLAIEDATDPEAQVNKVSKILDLN